MVEAGVLGTLLREGLRAGPGEPGESPSPATSWISRAREATSFTSVWLSLQPAGGKAGPCGLLPVRPHGGAAGDRSRGGGGDSVPQAGAGGPTRRWPPGEGRGTEPPELASAERQGPAGRLGERRAETPPGPGHAPLSCGHRGHTGPAPRDTEVGSPIRVRVRPAQRGQGPPHRTAGQVTAPGTSRTPHPSAPRRERLEPRWGPAPCPWLPAKTPGWSRTSALDTAPGAAQAPSQAAVHHRSRLSQRRGSGLWPPQPLNIKVTPEARSTH